MPSATLQFHGSLLAFLPARSRARGSVEVEVDSPRGVVDAIQAAGVPHTEVDLILAGGRALGLEHRLSPGDRIEVFGLDRPVELSGLPGLLPKAPSPVRFVLDGHLGRLARYLRMLGFDSRYDPHAHDVELARISAAEGRILLTRDRGLLKRSIVRLGYLVREDDARRQLAEVVSRYQLAGFAAPFSRCVRCNGEIRAVDVAEVRDELADQPRTLRYFDQFGRCQSCGTVYWPGSHYDRMSRLISEVVGAPSPSALPPAGTADRRA